MLYEFDLTIPANTTQAAPTTLEAHVSAGNVTQVEVQIPLGCKGLTHVQVLDSTHQLWPSNPDANIKGDDARIVWREDHDMDDFPYTLILRGWNEDDSYPHTITFRFAMLPPSVKEAAREPSGLLGRIAEHLGLGG